MTLRIREYKALARERLIGRYGSAIGSMLLLWIVPLIPLFFAFFFLGIGMFGIYGRGELASVLLTVTAVILFVCCAAAFVILYYFLAIGQIKLYLGLCRGEACGVSEMFYGFRKGSHPFRFLLSQLLLCLLAFAAMSLYMVLAASIGYLPVSGLQMDLLFVGLSLFWLCFMFWLFMGFAMVGTILIDRPETGILTAFGRSRRLMRRRKLKLLLLSLSFLPWVIPYVLTFGLAHFWIAPYESFAFLIFYLEAEKTEAVPGSAAWQAASESAESAEAQTERKHFATELPEASVTENPEAKGIDIPEAPAPVTDAADRTETIDSEAPAEESAEQKDCCMDAEHAQDAASDAESAEPKRSLENSAPVRTEEILSPETQASAEEIRKDSYDK